MLVGLSLGLLQTGLATMFGVHQVFCHPLPCVEDWLGPAVSGERALKRSNVVHLGFI